MFNSLPLFTLSKFIANYTFIIYFLFLFSKKEKVLNSNSCFVMRLLHRYSTNLKPNSREENTPALVPFKFRKNYILGFGDTGRIPKLKLKELFPVTSLIYFNWYGYRVMAPNSQTGFIIPERVLWVCSMPYGLYNPR